MLLDSLINKAENKVIDKLNNINNEAISIELKTTATPWPQTYANNLYEAPSFGDTFGIQASGGSVSNLHKELTASKGHIYIGGNQDEPKNCSSTDNAHDVATFVWKADQKLYLYTNESVVQEVWSDTGDDGLVGYSTNKKGLPHKQSLSPFEIDRGTRIVTFNGDSPIACPAQEAANQYNIYFTDSVKPKNLDGCFSVDLKAYKITDRDACTYSQSGGGHSDIKR